MHRLDSLTESDPHSKLALTASKNNLINLPSVIVMSDNALLNHQKTLDIENKQNQKKRKRTRLRGPIEPVGFDAFNKSKMACDNLSVLETKITLSSAGCDFRDMHIF